MPFRRVMLTRIKYVPVPGMATVVLVADVVAMNVQDVSSSARR